MASTVQTFPASVPVTATGSTQRKKLDSAGKASWPTDTTDATDATKATGQGAGATNQQFGTIAPVTTPEGDILPPQQAVFTPNFEEGAGKISAAPTRDELLKSAIDMKDVGLDQQIFARAKTNMDIQRQQELQAIDSDLAKRGIYNSGIGVRARVLANAKSDEQLKDLSAQLAIAETARNRDDAMKSIQLNMDAWKQKQAGELGVVGAGLETAAAQRSAANQELQGTLSIQQIQSQIQDNETRTALLMDQAQQAMINGNIELANQLAGMAQASTDASNAWRAQAIQAQNTAESNRAIYGGISDLGASTANIGIKRIMDQQDQANKISDAQKRLDELKKRPGPGLS